MLLVFDDWYKRSLSLEAGCFTNEHLVYSARDLSLSAYYFNNRNGRFIGERHTDLLMKSHFNNAGGVIATDGLLHVLFKARAGVSSLGELHGEHVVLEDQSEAEHFTLKDGTVYAQDQVTLVGNAPHMPSVHFVTRQLFLDADGFDLGTQKDV